MSTLAKQYNTCLAELLEKHAPLQTREIILRNRDPWYHKEIHQIKSKCRQAERKWRKNKNSENHLNCTQIQNKLNTSIRNAKAKYYNELIENEPDKKKLFNIVNKIMLKRVDTPMPEHNSPTELANNFNTCFKTKIDNIRKDFVSNDDFF